MHLANQIVFAIKCKKKSATAETTTGSDWRQIRFSFFNFEKNSAASKRLKTITKNLLKVATSVVFLSLPILCFCIVSQV